MRKFDGEVVASEGWRICRDRGGSRLPAVTGFFYKLVRHLETEVDCDQITVTVLAAGGDAAALVRAAYLGKALGGHLGPAEVRPFQAYVGPRLSRG